MNILIISPDYPDKFRTRFSFVKQLVEAFVRKGHICTVVAPYNVAKNRHFPHHKETIVTGYGKYDLIRPYTVSLSTYKYRDKLITNFFHERAVKNALNKLTFKPDVVYGHFWQSAYEGYEYAKRKKIPLFVATGESDILEQFQPQFVTKSFFEYVSGVICVSSKNKEESIRLGLTLEGKCLVAPNSINSSLFKNMNKIECRERLGFPKGAFIVAFVGWFINRKGAKRVAEAIAGSGTPTVYSIFIGQGDEEPICDSILHKGALPNEQIPLYLNAADIFVLPTLKEGCCNAIIEAMACGLPIVSSNLPFNWDVLDASNSIMIDPNDVNAIRSAIVELRDNHQRKQELSIGALNKAKELTIDKRAERIIDFINLKLQNNDR